MKRNGNPAPSFKTNSGRTYFLTELLIQRGFAKAQKAQAQAQAGAQAQSLSSTERRILKILAQAPTSISELSKAMGYRSLVGSVKAALKRLEEIQAVGLTIPEKPRSPHQKRILTSQGRRLLKGS